MRHEAVVCIGENKNHRIIEIPNKNDHIKHLSWIQGNHQNQSAITIQRAWQLHKTRILGVNKNLPTKDTNLCYQRGLSMDVINLKDINSNLQVDNYCEGNEGDSSSDEEVGSRDISEEDRCHGNSDSESVGSEESCGWTGKIWKPNDVIQSPPFAKSISPMPIRRSLTEPRDEYTVPKIEAQRKHMRLESLCLSQKGFSSSVQDDGEESPCVREMSLGDREYVDSSVQKLAQSYCNETLGGIENIVADQKLLAALIMEAKTKMEDACLSGTADTIDLVKINPKESIPRHDTPTHGKSLKCKEDRQKKAPKPVIEKCECQQELVSEKEQKVNLSIPDIVARLPADNAQQDEPPPRTGDSPSFVPDLCKSLAKLHGSDQNPANVAIVKSTVSGPYDDYFASGKVQYLPRRAETSPLRITCSPRKCRPQSAIGVPNNDVHAVKKKNRQSYCAGPGYFNKDGGSCVMDGRSCRQEFGVRPLGRRDDDKKRRNDREEIRRRLAMGTDEDYVSPRRRSLQARLQSNMNLQICFMNETASDNEDDCGVEAVKANVCESRPRSTSLLVQAKPIEKIPTKFSTIIKSSSHCTNQKQQDRSASQEYDFFSCQARLQAEARLALAQAHQMARMQMEVERQKKKKSPIAEMVGVPQLGVHRRLTRQLLTKMNVAQLQLIVNDFHSQIECLNEELVRLLLGRDDLHMEQDSMLVDIEDLTRYLGAKENNLRQKPSEAVSVKKEVTQNKLPRGIRIQSLIKK